MSTTPPVDDGRISSMGALLVLAGDEVVPVVTPAGENKKVKVSLLYGKTAYQLYSEAEAAAGRTPLSQAQWLASLEGPIGNDGPSAYQGYAAAETAAGRTPLSEADWLKSLQGPSAYKVYSDAEIAAGRTPLAQAAWLTSLNGKSAYEVYKASTSDNPVKTEAQWLVSLQGTPGSNGTDGAVGKSAYQSYRDTTQDNPVKSEVQWIASLKGKDGTIGNDGADGKSAYEVYANSTTDNPVKTQTQWLNSLVGKDGAMGVGLNFVGVITAEETLPPANTLVDGDVIVQGTHFMKSDGTQWIDLGDFAGPDGKSAYDLYLETTADNPKKTLPEWLASLKGDIGVGITLRGELQDVTDLPVTAQLVGDTYTIKGYQYTWVGVDLSLNGSGWARSGVPGPQGKSAYDGYAAIEVAAGRTPLDEAGWLASLKGKDGTDGAAGKSAFQSYLDTTTDNPKKTEAQWLTSLVGGPGEKGEDGDAGKSAYQIYLDTTTDNPKKSETEWLTSLKGEPGAKGQTGAMGTGLNFVGNVGANDPLPPTDDLQDGDVIVQGTHFMKFNGVEYVDLGNFGGPDGKTAYDLYVENTADNPVKSLPEWLASLKGDTGTGLQIRGELQSIDDLPTAGQIVGDAYIIDGYQKVWIGAGQALDGTGWATVGVPGPDGKSAYESYRAAEIAASRVPLSEADWLKSLIGKSAYEVYVASVPNGETPMSQAGWLASLKGNPGNVGNTGPDGKSAFQSYLDTTSDNPKKTEVQWLASLKGDQGAGIVVLASVADVAALNAAPQAPTGQGYLVGSDPANYYQWNGTAYVNLGPIVGPIGPDGVDGKSAYDLYKDTTTDNPVKTEAQWLASLKGEPGTDGGKGDDGEAGKSAFQSYLDTTADNPKKTEAQWIASLHGADGNDGNDGAEGKSAYEIYASTTSDNPVKTQAQWLASLKGAQVVVKGHVANQAALPTTGNAVNDGYVADDTGHLWVSDGATNWTDVGKFAGTDGRDGTDGTNGTDGTDGAAGKSAFQSYLDTTTDNPKKTEAEWLVSLKGKDGTNGTNGTDGDSAYEVYVLHTSDNPVKTEAQWLASLHGLDGAAGKSAFQSYLDTTTDNPKKTETQWLQALQGQGIVPKGTLANIAALNAVTGMAVGWMYFVGTHMYVYGYNSSAALAWLDQGDMRGPIGADGLDAYQVYAAAAAAAGQTPLDQASWLETLKGDKGDTGATGRAIHMGAPVADITALNALTGMQQGDCRILQNPQGQLFAYDTTNGWVDQGNLQGPVGEQGPMGPGVEIIGKLNNSSELPGTGTLGQGYLIAGNFWGWTGSQYENLGAIQGPRGLQGIQGPVGPIGPIGPIGPDGRRGSQIIILARDPQVTDGSDLSSDVFINITLQTVYQKTSPTNWAYLGTFGGGNVMDAPADGVKRIRQNAGWITLPVDEGTPDANYAATPLLRDPVNHTWKPLNRYDLPIRDISSDGVMDMSLYQAFKVDGTKTMTLTLTNRPANRFMTVVVVVNGSGAGLTWPTGLVWADNVAPTMGATRSDVVLAWDGTNLLGMVGPSA